MPKIIDLKIDRNLINSNFDGYKLSLDPIPILKQTLSNGIFKTKPKSTQYSIHFIELFSLQNLLIQDPWNRNASYFIDSNGSVAKVVYNESIGRPMDMESVFKIEGLSIPPQPGDYNLSFQFISEKYCLLCNGENEIQLLETGDRYKTPSVMWKRTHKTNISQEYNNFVIKDARLDIIEEGRKCISCCLQRVHQYEENGSHFNQIFWCTIKQQPNNQWGDLEIKDVLYGKGTIQYCAFELKSGSIILASSKEFGFESMKNRKLEDNKPIDFRYSWTQNNEDITVILKLLENENQNTFKISSTDDKLTIYSSETESILDSKLFGKIDSNLTTWNWEERQLSITLVKAIANQLWPFLVENGPKESIITTSSVESTMEEEDKPVISNLDEIDECDFPNDLLDADYAIDRFNFESKNITHKVILGNTPILFTTVLRPGFPPAFGTRYDVDTSLWLQNYNPSKKDEFSFRHDGNLHAFGYIQASKQQKKFIGCAPDLSYSIISESFRHIFIYKSKYDTAGGLRCRTGPNISIGKQHLVTLDDACGEVVGMSCNNNFVTLLTESYLLYLQINLCS